MEMVSSDMLSAHSLYDAVLTAQVSAHSLCDAVLTGQVSGSLERRHRRMALP